MEQRRIFMITHTDTSRNYGVGKYISEITKEAMSCKTDFHLIIITIGVLELMHPKKVIQGAITKLDIPRPLGKLESTELLTGVYSDAVFCIINDFFSLNWSDIFHFNNPQQSYLFKKVLETPVKIIYVIHTSLWKVYYKNDFKRFLRAWHSNKDQTTIKKTILAEKEICELADRVICLNDEMMDDVSKIYNTEESKIRRIPNGISLDHIKSHSDNLPSIRGKFRIAKSDFVFLYVGRLHAQKGISSLIAVFEQILKSDLGKVKLLIVGDGDLMPKLRNQNRHLKNDILFTGYIQPEDIRGFYSLANAMVFPSMNEQSSYVILEAMAYKVPMVVTDIMAFDFLIDEDTCLKISCKNQNRVDKNDLRKKMEMMMANEEGLCKRIADNAFLLYLESFTTTKMFEATYSDL